jgi:hypothetical protein
MNSREILSSFLVLFLIVVSSGCAGLGGQGEPETDQTSNDLQNMQKVQNTDIDIEQGYSSDGQMTLTIKNSGTRTINTSKFSIHYAPPDFPEPVRYRAVEDSWKTEEQNCLTGNMLLAPSKRLSCGTGIKVPEQGETVKVEIMADKYDYSTTA